MKIAAFAATALMGFGAGMCMSLRAGPGPAPASLVTWSALQAITAHLDYRFSAIEQKLNDLDLRDDDRLNSMKIACRRSDP